MGRKCSCYQYSNANVCLHDVMRRACMYMIISRTTLCHRIQRQLAVCLYCDVTEIIFMSPVVAVQGMSAG